MPSIAEAPHDGKLPAFHLGDQRVAARRARCALAVAALLIGAAASAQVPDPERLAEQREAMRPLAMMHGVWRGPAWTLRRDGSTHDLVQTERIGPFLNGTVLIIEGRGYEADGRVGFNALGTVSYEPRTRQYTLASHAMGYSGQFPFKPTADGYVWEVPAGPGTVIRYTAVIKGDRFVETGERIATPAPPTKVFEMKLQRLGDTAWPADGAVPMR